MQRPQCNWTIAVYSFLHSHLLVSSAFVHNAVTQKNTFHLVGVLYVQVGPSLWHHSQRTNNDQ